MNPNTTFVALDNPSIQFPLIHLNGNSGQKLGGQYWEAFQALEKLQEKFSEIQFHARDYYPLGDEAWLKARAQREAMSANINSLRNYLSLHSQHCFESC
jgi:hypothetical protein